MEIGYKYKTFENRQEAAQLLVPLLTDLKDSNPLVLAIPRGAVPMAHLIAQSLNAPMDLVLVKKLGHPQQPELAIGAVSENGEIFLSPLSQEIDTDEIERASLRAIEKLRRLRRDYTGFDTTHNPNGKTVIIVDDGIATGSTMLAAVRSLKSQGAQRIIIAAPVASQKAIESLKTEGVELRVFYVPKYFGAVSYFYKDFDQVSDAEIGAYFKVQSIEVEILNPRSDLTLRAIIGRPRRPLGLVLFAHGSGSGRLSPRNQFVADFLNHRQMATVLVDLLTDEEAKDKRNVFDIDLLAQRLLLLIDWIRTEKEFKNLPIGLFGASTGAAAALIAATLAPDNVDAVVSRGGRPDLAHEKLYKVKCPVLLIVGGEDHGVIELNQSAYEKISADKKIEIIPGATHLFEEPGALDQVASYAFRWFDRHFRNTKYLNPNFELPTYP